MIRFDDIPKIYLVSGTTDLRKGIDGYAHIIQNHFHLDPFQDALFLFCNRHHNKLKCLYWDGTGFWLLFKRLEKGNLKWINNRNDPIVITHQQLKWLLEGLKIEQKSAFKKSEKKYV